MRHGSLFSGIGGFDLAAEWMGWENKFHCEWNEFGQKVLKYYWPNSESFSDITKTDFTKWVQFVNSSTVNGSTVGALNAEFRITFNAATFGRYLGVKSSSPGFALLGAYYPVPGETYTLEYQFSTPNSRELYFWFGQANDTGPATITIPANQTSGIVNFVWGASTIGEWYMKTGTGTNMTTIMTIKLGNIYCPGPTVVENIVIGDKELKYLDTYKYEPVNLTYNIADIQDISKRNSSFSTSLLSIG